MISSSKEVIVYWKENLNNWGLGVYIVMVVSVETRYYQDSARDRYKFIVCHIFYQS